MVMTFRSRNYRIAIAIDFGTARSGYAYQFFEDKDAKDPIFRNKWPDTNEFYPKTPTEILFRPDGEVEAWGHTARKRFTQLREEAAERGYVLIENFKTLLHDGQDLDEDGPFIMREGRKFSVMKLIGEFLRFVKEVALRDIAETLGGDGLLDENEIRWCLTVPAVWRENSKQVMCRAAQLAGLIGEGTQEADRLLLVLEPEAAAVHCQQVMMRQNEVALESGKVIMIVDAGGGTVDITVHEVKVGKGLDELVPCGGGLHGSKYVDSNFRDFLACKLCAEAIDKFQAEWPVEYAKLMSETWEHIKCSYDAAPNWRSSIEIPRRLEKLLESNFPEVLDRLENSQGGDNTVIRLTHDDMEKILKSVIDQLVIKVENQFTALKNQRCNILFLVGGFAESPVLKQRIKDEFSDRVDRIVVPDRPGATVLQGAASFGVNPGVIVARRSRLTYGTGAMKNFDEALDCEHGKRISAENRSKTFGTDFSNDGCKNRFDIFVAAGERVPSNAVVTRSYIIPFNSTEFTIKFLSTHNPKVRYTDVEEDDVTEIAQVDLRFPFALQDSSTKPMEIEMQFGQSQIIAYAIDPISGNRERCEFRFSSSH
jgi:molecular chaperone DnaK (HSP70)